MMIPTWVIVVGILGPLLFVGFIIFLAYWITWCTYGYPKFCLCKKNNDIEMQNNIDKDDTIT